jgi:hypothetical protein
LANIESPFWLWIKGGLFVAIGCLCLVFVAMVTQSAQLVAVCCLAIWAFCRAYYFAFYVIENYIDPKFRFAGLLSVLGYFLDKDQIGTEDIAPAIERKDAVLANAHQMWLAIACCIVLYPYLPVQFTDLPPVNELGLMIHLGLYASLLGTLAFWAVFCAMPLAYRTSLFLVLVGIVGLSEANHELARINAGSLIVVSTYSLSAWLGFLIVSTWSPKVLASCQSPTRGKVRTISIRFLLGWMCVISFACIFVKWIPISSWSWRDTFQAVVALAVAVPFYVAMTLLLSQTILQAPSSQSPQRLLLYVVLWFAVSQACLPMFGYCFAIAYDDLVFEIPILFLSCLFFQTLLFLFLRMASERLIAIPTSSSPMTETSTENTYQHLFKPRSDTSP